MKPYGDATATSKLGRPFVSGPRPGLAFNIHTAFNEITTPAVPPSRTRETEAADDGPESGWSHFNEGQQRIFGQR